MRVSWQPLQQLPAKHWKNGITWKPSLQKISEPRLNISKNKNNIISSETLFSSGMALSQSFNNKNSGIFNLGV